LHWALVVLQRKAAINKSGVVLCIKYTYHFGDEYIRRKSELIRFLKATLPKKEAPHSD